MSQKALSQVLRQLPRVHDRNLIVGAEAVDDAGVYRLNATQALVQTVDFFTPIVDDPFLYGQIAAANALSDIYAMGGRPLTALNIVGMPADRLPPPIIGKILRGGALKAKEAHCVVLGGHTIRSPEPIYGLSVTGLVSPKRIISNTAARPGDWLVLTKPLGTGIITTGIKRGLTSSATARKAIRIMLALNRVGADLAEAGLVDAGVDVTGFGLLGHLGLLTRYSGIQVTVYASKVPVIDPELFQLIQRDCIPGGTRENLKDVDAFTDWGKVTEAQQYMLADAQTSGGLLLCVRPKHLEKVLDILRHSRTPCAVVIGTVQKSPQPRIRIEA